MCPLALMWLCIETAPHIPREWGGQFGTRSVVYFLRPCLSRPSIFGARRGLQGNPYSTANSVSHAPSRRHLRGADIGGAFGKVGQAIPIQTAIAIRIRIRSENSFLNLFWTRSTSVLAVRAHVESQNIMTRFQSSATSVFSCLSGAFCGSGRTDAFSASALPSFVLISDQVSPSFSSS